MSTKLRTCTGCNEALGRPEFSKNQWMKGPGTSRCKGCVSGPAAGSGAKDTPALGTVTPPAPELKPAAAPPSSTDFGRSAKAPSASAAKKKVVEKTPETKKSADAGSPPNSTTFGSKKTKSKTTSSSSSASKNKKSADKKAALATINSAVPPKPEARAVAAATATLSADQKAGEPSTEAEDASAENKKKVKVKTSTETEKEVGGIRKFFGKIVKGIKSWTSPVINPCLKAITGQVVTEPDEVMKKELEKEKYSLEGRS